MEFGAFNLLAFKIRADSIRGVNPRGGQVWGEGLADPSVGGPHHRGKGGVKKKE